MEGDRWKKRKLNEEKDEWRGKLEWDNDIKGENDVNDEWRREKIRLEGDDKR